MGGSPLLRIGDHPSPIPIGQISCFLRASVGAYLGDNDSPKLKKVLA